MPTPSELQLRALSRLSTLQAGGSRHVFPSREFQPEDRRTLLRIGRLQPIMRGWYMSARPDESAGDSTAWTAHWQEFVARYCQSRFKDQWRLSPEHSLHVLTSTPLPTRQILVHAKAGTNNVTSLVHGWSILDIRADVSEMPTEVVGPGLRVMPIDSALLAVSEPFFQTQPHTAQIAMELLPDASAIARHLIEAGKPVVAGRLIGALRAIGRSELAQDLERILEAAGYRLTASNPFAEPPRIIDPAIKRSSHVLRIHQLWENMRGAVIRAFPSPPGRVHDIDAYMNDVDARYVADALNSLSIEGYHVNEALIEQVRAGNWNPDTPENKASRDAMAAKGYSLAHQAVKESIRKILVGDANPGTVFRQSLTSWYIALWKPSVDAQIVRAEALAGYRNSPVFIRNADHVPPSPEAVRDCMPALFELLEKEEHAAVRAVLGHFIFVYIHPYMDGNGRIGRFLMNAMFASGGYPWVVIPFARRSDYMNALNAASGGTDLAPFANLVAEILGEQSHPAYHAGHSRKY